MASWAEEQVLFFYLFAYSVFVFEWQAPNSGSWCQLQLGILYELTRDPLSKFLVPSESQLDAVCRGPKTPCFPSKPTAALELDSWGCQGTCFACGHSRLAFTWKTLKLGAKTVWRRVHPVALGLFTSGFSRAKKTCTIPPGVRSKGRCYWFFFLPLPSASVTFPKVFISEVRTEQDARQRAYRIE